jgi:hypothetical protein
MLAYDNVNYSKKLIILFGRHLISNAYILVTKEKGSPSPMPHDLCILRFMITFTLCFTKGKCTTSEGTFPKA